MIWTLAQPLLNTHIPNLEETIFMATINKFCFQTHPKIQNCVANAKLPVTNIIRATSVQFLENVYKSAPCLLPYNIINQSIDCK